MYSKNIKEPSLMRAIVVNGPGKDSQLKFEVFPRPTPGPDEIRVKVMAAGVNRADILQRQGLYPPPAGSSQILGLEIAGTVEAVGASASNWKKGERVFGLLTGGGYAQYAVIHQELAMPIPDELSFEEAAAIPEAFLTAFQSLIKLGNLNKNQTILIHAGGSGVGTAAIQIARHMGSKVIITAGSDEKVSRCRQLGAAEGINYRTTDFHHRVMEITGGKGVDLILDFVGKPFWEKNISALAIDGTLILLATMGGSSLENFDLRTFIKKRLTVMGSTLRNRSKEYKINLTREFAYFALPLFRNKSLKAVIDRIFPWEAVAEAHQHMQNNLNFGKIVLAISHE